MNKIRQNFRRFLQDFYLVLIMLFLYAPIATMVVLSFNSSKSRTQWGGFTLQWYTQMFASRNIMAALQNTLLIAFLSALIATIIGTAASIAISSMKQIPQTIVMGITNIPMLNADIVTGISLMLAFIAFGVSLGFKTVLIAHITFNIPHVILTVAPKLRQLDRNLVDAAKDLGCTWMQAFWKVILPEIKPGIVSGALIAFTMSIDDFIISYFTAGTSSTLAMTIYGMTKKRVSPEINAVSTLLFVTVLALLAIVNIREARQEKLAAAQRAR